MSWNNCKKCLLPRSGVTSSLLKVLLTLKLLHSTRSGSKGSTVEEISMYMLRHFNIDGDIKSQVLASLKFGVKMHFINKRKDKFALVLPASSVVLAPCKAKSDEIDRITCIFPAKWQASCGTGGSCGGGGGETSCCGQRQRQSSGICCYQGEEHSHYNNQEAFKKRSKSSFGADSQHSHKRFKHGPCPKPRPPACRGHKKKKSDGFDDFCQMCNEGGSDSEDDGGYQYNAVTNCRCCAK